MFTYRTPVWSSVVRSTGLKDALVEVMRQLPGPGKRELENFVLCQLIHHDCMVTVANESADAKQRVVALLDGKGEHLLLNLPDRCGKVGGSSGCAGEGEGWHRL